MGSNSHLEHCLRGLGTLMKVRPLGLFKVSDKGESSMCIQEMEDFVYLVFLKSTLVSFRI